MKVQGVASLISISLALGLAGPVQAEDRPDAAQTGFYGGVSMRDGARDGPGITIGNASSVWNRYVTPTADDTSQRSLLFGGYRFGNDIAVEASFNSLDKYSLKPADAVAGARGVGLNFGTGNGIGDSPSRTWNLDVFTSWQFYRAFALYGRLGYSQSDTAPVSGVLAPAPGETRRFRDGVNYGLGVRYDMNSALGLRVEYGRFGRFAGEVGAGPLSESDQVIFGVQFRF
jgi:hypothetical protein